MARTTNTKSKSNIVTKSETVETQVNDAPIEKAPTEETTIKSVHIAVDEVEDTKPLSMEEKITLRSIANWTVGFNKIESNGEVNINAGGSIRLPRAEVISQFENGNKLLRGEGNGEHATIFIDDKATRDYLDIKAEFIDKNKLNAIFNISGLNDFRNAIKSTFKTKAEKALLIKLIRENNYNDFNKVRECEVHCNTTV